MKNDLKKLTIKNAKKIQREAIRRIAPWVLKYLLGKKIAANVEITFKIVPNLQESEGIEGSTSWEDSNHKPREFLVELDGDQDINSFILAMCHEMVHVKQYALGEMKDIFKGPNNLVWKGTKINTLSPNNKYWEQPWEIEAFGREQGLYVMWKEANLVADHETFEKCLKYL
jgi:hypothetical protein